MLMHERRCETRRTGIEPATTGVTSRYSNQLSYRPKRNSETAERFRTMDVIAALMFVNLMDIGGQTLGGTTISLAKFSLNLRQTN